MSDVFRLLWSTKTSGAKMQKSSLKVSIRFSSTCGNCDLITKRVTCAEECPDERQRKDQLHHDEQVGTAETFVAGDASLISFVPLYIL